MPESSIVVTLVDRYSDSAKKMTAVTRAFSKDVDELEEQLQKLNKNKYSLKVDAQKAKQALKEAEKQFAEEAEDIEDAAIRAVMLEKLNEALHTLTDEETAIIHALFYQEISEVELAKRLGIARTTLQSRKYRILEKLKKLL